MPFEREDLKDLPENQRGAQSPDTSRLRAIQQQAIRAEHLTGDPAWDQYLSYVQAQIDQAKKNRDGFMARLSSPNLVNADQVSLARVSIIRLDQMVAALEWAIALPSQIKKLGEVAKEQLDALELIEAEAEQAA